jgi:hypothetical protein
MKINIWNIISFACISIMCISCGKFETSVAPMTPIDIGGSPDTYALLDENSTLTIPVNFTTTCDSGLKSASYKVANKRASEISLVFSPAIAIPFNDKSVSANITVPVRKGLMSVVITIYDKAGKLSYKSISIKSMTPAEGNVKSLTDVVMSTDPADNQCFFSLYETTPVFGRADALTKQGRVDFILANMSGAKFISCHAFSASADYYTTTKPYLAGFTSLTYSFISASQTYITRDAFDAIAGESDLARFVDSTLIRPAPKGNNYNVIKADRRVSEAFNETAVNKGLIVGWGYHTAPTEKAALLKESFALVFVKSVTKKANGHYIVTFDVKAPATDQRTMYNFSSIAPYDPYPL